MFPILSFPAYEPTAQADAMRQAVQCALDAVMSRKEAAGCMGLSESTLSRQLAGYPGTHLSLWRLSSLPEAFWSAFDAMRAEARGAVLVSPELVALLRGAATMKRVVLKAALSMPQKVEQAK